jgi:hypothetical protein
VIQKTRTSNRIEPLRIGYHWGMISDSRQTKPAISPGVAVRVSCIDPPKQLVDARLCHVCM